METYKDWEDGLDNVMNGMLHSSSTRSYSSDHIPNDMLSELNAIAAKYKQGPFGTPVRYKFQNHSCGANGMIYGCHSSLAGCCAFDEKNAKYCEVDFAYGMEKIIIECRARQLGTLWLAVTFDFELAKKAIDIKENEKLWAVNCVGPMGKPGMFERMAGAVFRLHTRHPWSKLFFDKNFSSPLEPKSVDDKMAMCLESLRSAPSGKNLQLWRVLRENEKEMHLFTLPGNWCLLDAGIAIARIETAAEHLGLPGRWVRKEEKEKYNWKELGGSSDLQYIATWVME